jgi:hypothetical protein
MAYPLVPSFPSGIGSPNAWVINITSGPTGVDLTTVTAVTLDAFRTQDLSRSTWHPAILGGATAASLNVQLAFSGLEITTLGPYEIAVTLTTPGGLVPSSAIACIAVDAHVLPPTPFLPGASTLVTPIAGLPGLSALSSHAVLIGTGAASIGVAGPGALGLPLVGQGVNADPIFAVIPYSSYAPLSVVNPAALTGTPSSALGPGFRAYVQSLKNSFYLDPTSVAVPDNITVIAAQSVGNWLAFGGSVSWANDLATSSSTQQWVSGLSGTGGTGATVTLRSGVSILQTQGGTLNVPLHEVLLKFQPRDPTQAPFTLEFQGLKFFSTVDSVMALGTNVNHPLNLPEAEYVIEQDFENAPGQHQLEMYIQCNKWPGGVQTDFVRPWSNFYRTAPGGVSQLGLAWLNGGSLQFGGGTTVAPLLEWQFNDGTTQIDPGGVHSLYTIECFSGTFLLEASQNFALDVLGSQAAFNTNAGCQFIWNVDQHVFRTGNPPLVGKCQLDLTVDNARFYPITDGQGTVGIGPPDLAGGSLSWKAGSFYGLTGGQKTVATAYVIDSGAIPRDWEIWANSSGGAFPITLPNPALNKGRKLVIIDCTNSFAAHNVTLTRFAAETINAVAGNLALATNGARYEISCDGTNFWVTKSVAGG